MNGLFSHILLPVDSSEECLAAGKLAVQLAKQWQARLTLLYVVDKKLVEELARIQARPQAEVREQLEATGWRYLSLCEHLARDEGVNVRKTLSHGSPAAEIVDKALSENIDLIVMAKSKQRGPRRLMLGRTLQRVIEDAECPLVVVKY
jgi:nucleotide-binding universal stress UspA family protein